MWVASWSRISIMWISNRSRECWPIDESSVILSHWWYDEEMTWFSIALILSTLLIITCTIPVISYAKHSKSTDSNSSGSNDSSDSKQTPTQTPTEQQTPEITEPTGSDNTQPLAEVPLFWYIRNYCRFCKFSTSK